MNAIRIRKQLESDTLHLPELQPFIGKTVEIIVLEDEPAARSSSRRRVTCFDNLPPAHFDPVKMEKMRPYLTPEQFEALWAIASQGGLDIEAIAQMRAAEMP